MCYRAVESRQNFRRIFYKTALAAFLVPRYRWLGQSIFLSACSTDISSRLCVRVSKLVNDTLSYRSDQKISSQPTPQKSAPILSHISAVAEDTQTIPYNDTQRKLATTRLQQEIEEQKRREMELRRDGRVRSISDEHINPTDSPSPENGEPAHQETLQSQVALRSKRILCPSPVPKS